jgi:predicted RNA-binding Zn ribbon-like protein
VAALRWSATTPAVAFDAAAAEEPAAATLAAVARSAIALLGGPDRDRLRRCEGEHCILVFVAAHPRRRWCSPNVCGNRARVARHYRRHRAG